MTEIQVDYTRCQGPTRHAWYDYDSTHWKTSVGSNQLTLRCERCDTEQRIVYDRRGNIMYRRYIYPRGYRYARGTRPSTQELRLALLALRHREARENKELLRRAHG